ncbi:hypothetical protein JTB14_017954 [Gonioctena quinquepunctata]|nr:hypothetical protein JTB14_017954 [Gonioctena quinquepunctata]
MDNGNVDTPELADPARMKEIEIEEEKVKLKHKYPGFRKNLKYYIQEFTDYTGIHGFKYMGEHNRSPFERARDNIPFFEATKKVATQTPSSGVSYANSVSTQKFDLTSFNKDLVPSLVVALKDVFVAEDIEKLNLKIVKSKFSLMLAQIIAKERNSKDESLSDEEHSGSTSSEREGKKRRGWQRKDHSS